MDRVPSLFYDSAAHVSTHVTAHVTVYPKPDANTDPEPNPRLGLGHTLAITITVFQDPTVPALKPLSPIEYL